VVKGACRDATFVHRVWSSEATPTPLLARRRYMVAVRGRDASACKARMARHLRQEKT